MKKCEKCGYTTERDARFCPQCGSPLEIQSSVGSEDTVVLKNICPNCHTPVSDPTSKYCYKCGAKLNNFAGHQNMSPPYYNKPKPNGKSALNRISSLENAVDGKLHIGPQNTRILLICVVCVLVLVIIASILFPFIHRCDECGNIYFGKKNTISFFDLEEDVCDECYKDFYSFF